jgi:hypothetical protein
MAFGENQSNLTYIKATPITASATVIGQTIRSSATVLSSILISSHTALTFKLWDCATAAVNPIGSTYTPAAGSSVINFQIPIEFVNGIWMTHSPALAFQGGIGGGSGLVFNVE